MTQISVVMPVYNGEAYVGYAIDSILNQTYKDFEFIIVDDGSRDKTPEILGNIQDSRVKTITFESNRGIVDALNEGIRISQGKYIARQDSDDISLPRRLEKQLNLIESDPELVLVAGGIKIIANNITDQLKAVEKHYCSYNTKSEVREQLRCLNSPIPHPTVLFRKDIYDLAGGYRKEFEFSEDTDLWYRMLKYGEMAKVPEVVVFYRRHPNAICYVKAAEQQERYRKILERVSREGV